MEQIQNDVRILPLPEFIIDFFSINPEVIKLYERIFGEFLKQGLTRGRRSNWRCIWASLYVAMRIKQMPVPLKEFAKTVNFPFNSINKIIMVIKKKVLPSLGLKYQNPSLDNYLDRFCKELGLSETIKDKAKKIIEIASLYEPRILSRYIIPLIGGAFYLAAKDTGEFKTQKTIGDTLGITYIVVGRRAHELFDILNSRK